MRVFETTSSPILFQESLLEQLRHALTQFNRPVEESILAKMATELARLIKTQPDFTGDKSDVWVERLINGYHTTTVHIIVIAIVRPDKQYRPLLRVWAPDTCGMGHELSTYLAYEHYNLFWGLDGGKWRDVTEFETELDDRSAPVEQMPVEQEDRTRMWVGGIVAALVGGVVAPCTYFMLGGCCNSYIGRH
jgi:hypothetical protein